MYIARALPLKRKDGIVATLSKGVDGLFAKNKVKRYRGHGRLDGPGRVIVEGEDAAELEAKHIVLATGSRSARGDNPSRKSPARRARAHTT